MTLPNTPWRCQLVQPKHQMFKIIVVILLTFTVLHFIGCDLPTQQPSQPPVLPVQPVIKKENPVLTELLATQRQLLSSQNALQAEITRLETELDSKIQEEEQLKAEAGSYLAQNPQVIFILALLGAASEKSGDEHATQEDKDIAAVIQLLIASGMLGTPEGREILENLIHFDQAFKANASAQQSLRAQIKAKSGELADVTKRLNSVESRIEQIQNTVF